MLFDVWEMTKELIVHELFSYFIKATSKNLFDIAFCNCLNRRTCSCCEEKKVPNAVFQFLHDQRNLRRMTLKSKFRELSISSDSGAKRIKRSATVTSSCDSWHEDNVSNDLCSQDVPMDSIETTGIGLRSRFVEQKEEKSQTYNTLPLFELARIADRCKVSNRTAAAIATAVLVDYGIINRNQAQNAVDKSKVARYRKKLRKKQVKKLLFDDIRGIYFDSRGDDTIDNSNNARRTVKEEHISFVEQPNSQYIGHKSVQSKCAKDIVKAIEELVDEKDIPVNRITSVGCDGTVTNTGYKHGAIRSLEEKWKKPLQWIICLLHMNELQLRALMTKEDGPTTGPRSFSGSIGSRLKTCEQEAIVDFEPVNFACDVENISDISKHMSTDQQLLFDMCRAVSKGRVSEELAKRKIGPICHSRWVTMAIRILRLYCSERSPSEILQAIVRYIMNVYAPMIFKLKQKSSIVHGALHLYDMIESSKCLAPRHLSIVHDSIARNAFFAHPESIILAMVDDEDENIRQNGWQKVLRARLTTLNNEKVRTFKVPTINFECQSYTDMVDMDSALNTDPPILEEIEVRENNIEFLASRKITDHDFGNFLREIPSNTQAVERCVQLVAQSAKNVCGEEARDGMIVNTLASRNVMNKIDSKQDYNFDENIANHLKI